MKTTYRWIIIAASLLAATQIALPRRVLTASATTLAGSTSKSADTGSAEKRAASSSSSRSTEPSRKAKPLDFVGQINAQLEPTRLVVYKTIASLAASARVRAARMQAG